MRTVPVFSAEQVRAAEAPLLAAGAPLMDRAAAALARVVVESLGAAGGSASPATGASPPRPRLLVLAGSGDNGGDALFAAARLTGGAEVDLLAVSARRHEAGLAAALAAGARAVDLAEAGAGDYDVVLDGILGIGAAADPRLRGAAREAVEALLPRVHAGRPRVFAVDLPSGLHPDTGDADDAVLPATTTVTFGAVKRGLVSGRGPELAGEIVLVDIGLGIGPGAVGAAPGEAEAAPEGTARVSRIL